MQSIASHTEGVLIVPQGTLSSKKESFVYRTKDSFFVEQVKGVEPSYRAWEARVLPMNYTCVCLLSYHTFLEKSRGICMCAIAFFVEHSYNKNKYGDPKGGHDHAA